MSRKIQEVNLETLTFSKTKVKSNNKFLYVYSDKKPLILKIEKARVPFGLQKDNLSSKNQYILDLALDSEGETLKSFEKFTKAVVEKVHKDFYSDKNIQDVEGMFNNFIKYPENSMFSPTLRTKIIVSDDNIPKCDFYSSEKNEDGKFPKIDVVEKGNEPYLLKSVCKGTHVETILECIGLWFFNDRFGISFKTNQMMIYPNTIVEKPTQQVCHFVDSDTETSNSDADFLDS